MIVKCLICQTEFQVTRTQFKSQHVVPLKCVKCKSPYIVPVSKSEQGDTSSFGCGKYEDRKGSDSYNDKRTVKPQKRNLFRYYVRIFAVFFIVFMIIYSFIGDSSKSEQESKKPEHASSSEREAFILRLAEIFSKQREYCNEYNNLINSAFKDIKLATDSIWIDEVKNILINISKLNSDMKALIIPDDCSEIREPLRNYCLAIDEYLPVLQQYAESLSEGKKVSEDFYDNELLKRYELVKETDAVLADFIISHYADDGR